MQRDGSRCPFSWFVAAPFSTGHSMVARQTSPFKRDEAAASYIPPAKGRESPPVGVGKSSRFKVSVPRWPSLPTSFRPREPPVGARQTSPLKRDEAAASYIPP